MGRALIILLLIVILCYPYTFFRERRMRRDNARRERDRHGLFADYRTDPGSRGFMRRRHRGVVCRVTDGRYETVHVCAHARIRPSAARRDAERYADALAGSYGNPDAVRPEPRQDS